MNDLTLDGYHIGADVGRADADHDGAGPITEHGRAILDAALPCPFCGARSVSVGFWSLDHEDVHAIECKKCYAGAPFSAWQKRSKKGE